MYYYRITESAALPEISAHRPFRAVVVADSAVSTEWQAGVSRWLVTSGCLYMMAIGVACSTWDDSVDIANIDAFPEREVPPESFVMTTWHEDEPIKEVFWFAKMNGHHADVEIENSLVIHVGDEDQRAVFREIWQDA